MEPSDLAHLWDLEAIAQTPLEVRTLAEQTAGLGPRRVACRKLRYTSHDGSGGPIHIAAQVAIPAAREPLPAVIMGTGDADAGQDFARRHRVATIVLDRPGTGESTGPEDLYTNWVHFSDPRESWMWHYITSALRAVTLAQTLPEIDPDRIGITGSSRGGTMAWIANGVDPRLKLSIPVATGGDIVRALDQGGWANYIHRDEEGKPAIPPAFYEFARYYDPRLYCGRQHGGVVLIVGAQDEFFPVLCTETSARASAADDFRLLLVANWDHGYFSGDNPQVQAFDNTREVTRKRRRTVAAAIAHWLRVTQPLPATPELAVEPLGANLQVRVSVDAELPIRRVRLYWSADSAYTYRAVTLKRDGEHYLGQLKPSARALPQTAVYAEVEYVRGPFLTSIPWLGPGFRQVMRPFPEDGG